MKRLLLITLLAAPIAAHAAEWTAPNTTGGYIHITTDRDPQHCGQNHAAWAASSTGYTTMGCWQASPDPEHKYIRVIWETGQMFTYNTADFTPVQ